MQSPTLDEIQSTRRRIDSFIVETPIWHWRNREIQQALDPHTQVFLKLELFQHTGSFKPRGALSVMLSLPPEALQRGVTAVSAGNHAIAVAFAAAILGSTAKVVMPKTANPGRIAKCRSYGAQVVLVEDVHVAFERVHQIEAEEGRTFVHPFEGPLTALGTATLGLELMRQVPDLEAVIVPIGGGGLCAGIAAAVKLLNPACLVFGVEPEGADSMHRSFASGKPEAIPKVTTIADSLGAPMAAPYSFGLCRQYVDDLALVNDDQLCQAMALLFHGVRLAVEPASAAPLAALRGSLRQRLQGKRIGLIISGANIDPNTYFSYLQRAEPKEANLP
jgi:threonine dehydratase